MRKFHFMLFAVIIFTGCATALPQQPVSDFKAIAGTWRGSNNVGNPVDLIVYDDGRFDAIIIAPQQTARRRGQIRMEGQQLVYDADSSYGRMTYQESDGRRRLTMYGTLKEDGTRFVLEFSPRNR
jgi:hypothetical protein